MRKSYFAIQILLRLDNEDKNKFMSEYSYIVRTMTETDLNACLAYTQAVGWPHTISDWQFHYDLGKGSVIEDKQGDVIGTILWWDYGADYATVGLVVVPGHMQGKGLGRTLMDNIEAQTGSRNLQLVSTAAGKRLYEQCGYTEYGKIYQIQGLPNNRQAGPLPEGVVCRQLDQSLLPDIITMANQAYKSKRTKSLVFSSRASAIYLADISLLAIIGPIVCPLPLFRTKP